MLTRDAAYMPTPEPSRLTVAGRALFRPWLAALALWHAHTWSLPSPKPPSRSVLLPPVKLAAAGFNQLQLQAWRPLSSEGEGEGEGEG